jgi:pyridoxal phosphate enzyme (YggS family)
MIVFMPGEGTSCYGCAIVPAFPAGSLGKQKSMASIAENICKVRTQIASAEQTNGRPKGSVILLAVSKTQSVAKIREAWSAGQLDFAENYVQEALAKMDTVLLPGSVWHFIGPIQTNKTRQIAARFDWVHSVDRLKIADRLDAQRPDDKPPLNVCIQVNLSGEQSKSGVALPDVPPLCEAISRMKNLCLRGLMAIPAPCNDPQQQRLTFRPLAALQQHLQQQYPSLDTLSIGMSGDFEAAIAEGATMVRIGTAIFGHRD